MQEICVICCENINKRRTEISCLHCDKKCCSSCFAMRLLSPEPNCMFCNKVIPDDFINENMTMTFNCSHREHKYQQQFIREKSLLPETQHGAEREKTARGIESRILLQIQNEIPYVRTEIYTIGRQLDIKEQNKEKEQDKNKIKVMKNEIQEKKKELKTRKKHLKDLSKQISSSKEQILILRRVRRDEPKEKEKEIKYTRACPDGDCRGFMSSAYKCGTCEKYFCSDCHIVKSSRDDKEHMCNEDIKASVKMINLDSKPCPKCSSYIYRTEGCSLMWCVKCHTQFDWHTLKIKNGYNHNPEYFRYLRENGKNVPRNPYDNARNCNDIPGYFMINSVLEPLGIRSYSWDRIYRHRLHIIDIVMRGLPERVEMIDCSDLRIGYLLSDYDEEKWKRKYFARLKKNEIDHERYKVYDMYCNVIKDNFLNLMTETTVETFVTFKDSCKQIEEYADEQLLKINKKYNSKNKAYLTIRSG